MADFLSQFIGKDETPSTEFKHHRGNRKVSDSATSNEELDSLYGQLIEASSDDDIKKVISEVNPNLVLSNREKHHWGEVLTFTVEGFDDFVYTDVPLYKTESLRRLADLISPKNLRPISPRRVTVKDAEGHNGRFGDSWLIRNMSDSGIRNFLHHLLPGTNPAIKFKGGAS